VSPATAMAVAAMIEMMEEVKATELSGGVRAYELCNSVNESGAAAC
jgi:hypothetical protein